MKDINYKTELLIEVHKTKNIETILPSSILSDIYCYLPYHDLREHKHVPDAIWRRMYNYYTDQINLKEDIKEFWGSVIVSCPDIISYKSRVLFFIPDVIKGNYNRPDKLLHARMFMLECAKHSHLSQREREYFADDGEIMLEMIKKEPWFFKDISPRLQNDQNFILEAITCNKYSILYVDHKWRKNAYIIHLLAYQCDIRCQDNLEELYQQCVGKMLTMKFDFFYYTYFNVPHELMIMMETKEMEWRNMIENKTKYTKLYINNSNQSTALTAIAHGMEFKDLSVELLDDKSFMLLALHHSPYYDDSKKHKYNKYPRYVLKDVGEKLKKDKEFVLKMLYDKEYNTYCLFYHIDPILRYDHDIVRCFIKNAGWILRYNSDLLHNKSLICHLIKNDLSLFRYIPTSFKEDIEWVRGILV